MLLWGDTGSGWRAHYLRAEVSSVTIYFAGAEDSEHYFVGVGMSVEASTGHARSTYTRCSLLCNSGGVSNYWQNQMAYASTPSTFWFSARYWSNGAGNNAFILLHFVDAANLVRLQLIGLSATVVGVQKVNTAGTATTLTNTLAAWVYAPTNTSDKLDISWVNAVSGTIDIYYNGVHVFNYSGDTTTETTAISYHRLHNIGNAVWWSEIIVADTDTRSWSLQTLAPAANGNTHSFDTGTPAAANINEITLNDTTLDGSTTAGQIDEYTIPAIAAGTWSIVAVGVSARAQKGASGPSKMDLVLRSGSTDYSSTDQSLTTTFANYQNWWLTDPNTSAAWTGLPVNIGLKSVT